MINEQINKINLKMEQRFTLFHAKNNYIPQSPEWLAESKSVSGFLSILQSNIQLFAFLQHPAAHLPLTEGRKHD